MNNADCQLNDFLKGLKAEYAKYIASQTKRIMFLFDEKNFIPNFLVQIDTDTLSKIFKILIYNAVKYTDKGYIKVGYRILEGDILQFFVEDTGSGFDPVILDKMTNYLASSDMIVGEKPETLSEVGALAQSLGGKVRIESQQGMGATIYFNVDYKPIQLNGGIENQQGEAMQAKKESSSQVKTNTLNNIWQGKTILIAEDEIVNYMFLEVLFEETGATLIHAADGRQAIDAVKSNPNINIVLMDIKMPNINGLEATRQIKGMRPQLPVIAQTAYAMQDDEYKALQAGCNDYISKPIDANKLISLMKKYLW